MGVLAASGTRPEVDLVDAERAHAEFLADLLEGAHEARLDLVRVDDRVRHPASLRGSGPDELPPEPQAGVSSSGPSLEESRAISRNLRGW